MILWLKKRPWLVGFGVALGAIDGRLIGDGDHGEAVGRAPPDQEINVALEIFSGVRGQLPEIRLVAAVMNGLVEFRVGAFVVFEPWLKLRPAGAFCPA